MASKERNHYARKHSPDQKPRSGIAGPLKERATNGEITCASAFGLAADLKESPGEVGVNADLLEIRVTKCQLGLFGYRPEKKVVRPSGTISKELEGAVREALIDKRLPCRSAWDIAKRFSVGKMEVSSACEALGIKISPCQLGAF
ncbi:MAG: hypothetical protein HQ561_14445 [Desulfobacteraceae bacterium]|nr:hypothetical protein [Desulfobacteraceae bacterium]